MFLSKNQVREVDQIAITEFGIPSVILMENAGRGCAELLIRLGIHAPVGIVCGKGNNGGDGFVMARHLVNHGFEVKVLLLGEPEEISNDSKVNYDIASRMHLPIQSRAKEAITADWIREELVGCEWVVDAIFGTGLSDEIRAPYDAIVEVINESGANVFSVDIPSGLDCDTGKVLGRCVKAQHTATFVAVKVGFAEETAQEWLGQVHVIGIGAPEECMKLACARIE
ncbi:MAG: NAD(P)H-hydrate epimerase [Gemmataceae bacterium]